MRISKALFEKAIEVTVERLAVCQDDNEQNTEVMGDCAGMGAWLERHAESCAERPIAAGGTMFQIGFDVGRVYAELEALEGAYSDNGIQRPT
jgi:hypothetical protein